MRTSSKAVGLKHGFRSGLEEVISKQLAASGLSDIAAKYETQVIPYVTPETPHKYKPDFPIRDGLYIETKGIFDSDDRQKHLLVKQQHPGLEVRFIFSRSSAPIYKGSKTTYAMWCEKNGFKYADKRIPEAWLKEFKK